MNQFDAFKLLSEFADNHGAIIVSDIGSQSLWLKAVKDRPENLYLSGPMGMASSVALGVAVSHKDRLVIAACGDGALAMNLSSLVTISNAAPKNLIVVVMDNGIYEFTRGIPVPSRAVSWSDIPAAFSGFSRDLDINDLKKLKPDDLMSGPYFVHAVLNPSETLPPGPGLHPVDVHHRFRRLVKESSSVTRGQSC